MEANYFIGMGRDVGGGFKMGNTCTPTPVFLHGEFHGQRSLADYSPWDCKESGTTEATEHQVIKMCSSG